MAREVQGGVRPAPGRDGGPSRSVLAAAALVAGCGTLAGAVLAGMLWSVLSPTQRDAVVGALEDQLPTIVAMGVLLVVGLGVLVAHLLGRYAGALQRLATELEHLDAARDHRVVASGPPEARRVAAGVAALAARRQEAEREVEAQVAAAAARLTQERNRLAALLSELAVAVVVCNDDGLVLLYNSAARALVDDEAALGIGRSVYGVVDRGLVAHAQDRIGSGTTSSAAATAVVGERLLEVRVAVVPEPSGFVLLLEDVTDQARAWARLTEHEQRPVTVSLPGLPLSDVPARELVRLVAAEVERTGAPRPAEAGAPEELAARVEAHALVRGVAALVRRLGDEGSARAVRVGVDAGGAHVRLVVDWEGDPVDAAALRRWAGQPVAAGAVPPLELTLARLDGRLVPATTASSLSVLLPRGELPRPAGSPGQAATPVPEGSDQESRPEFYDFDLFERRPPTSDPTGDGAGDPSTVWADVPLADLAYTVFDTETTGLLPTQGDEIVSLGAVRVVNGRILRQEGFERLVDPQRSVPEVSTAVHGLTREMLTGRPTLATVLPQFARYAADTVLVGHNVGFDLQFLRVKEAATGVRLRQPVLDTLLLDAVVDPGEERHSLEAIAARMGIEVVDRHSALGDARVTAEVLLRLLPRLERRGIRTLGQALEASRTTLQARLDERMYGG